MKKISVVTPCFNEEENIIELISRISEAMLLCSDYTYEHIIIDNSSSDNTVGLVKRAINSGFYNVKLIVNSRNYGHIRSPIHGLLQADGDAVILIASDLQDPPELIPDFVKKWELGAKSVFAVKPASSENSLMFFIRKQYYKFLSSISETPVVANATGAGLFSRSVIDSLRTISDPYPYFRGLMADLGNPIDTVEFVQPSRARGVTKNNFYTLFDIALLGITNHSKVPLRIISLIGFILSFFSIVFSIIVLFSKLVFWDAFELGIAPLMIGIFFIGGVQMFMIGVVGEYVGAILTHVRNMPLVVELERYNFD